MEYAARVRSSLVHAVRYGDRMFYEDNVRHVDPDLFNIFSIPFILGNPATALTRPNTAVLTATMAQKYFPGEHPLGKTLHIDTTA